MTKINEPDSSIRQIRARMIRILAAVIVLISGVSIAIISGYSTGHFGGSYFLGAGLGVANGVVGFVTIEKFIDKSTLVFLKGVFLGMGIRLMLLLGIFILLIKVFDRDIVALVVGLLIFYFAMTVFEIIFLNRRLALKKGAKVPTP